jgi:hypothetical protein
VLPFVDIGSQVYVVAPLAVSVAEFPAHTVAEIGTIDNAPLTATEPVAELVQVPFEPTTV